MPKLSFNRETLGRALTDENGNVRHAEPRSAFEPIVSDKAGVEALHEALRFANVQGSKLPNADVLAEDVDTAHRTPNKRRP